MAAKKKTASKTPNPVIASNKKAAFNYFFEERHETGMVLQSWEVKALRAGKAQLTDGYVVIRRPAILVSCSDTISVASITISTTSHLSIAVYDLSTEYFSILLNILFFFLIPAVLINV